MDGWPGATDSLTPPECLDAPLLGCAVLASVGGGVHGTVEEAVEKMVRVRRRVEPDKSQKKVRLRRTRF